MAIYCSCEHPNGARILLDFTVNWKRTLHRWLDGLKFFFSQKSLLFVMLFCAVVMTFQNHMRYFKINILFPYCMIKQYWHDLIHEIPTIDCRCFFQQYNLSNYLHVLAIMSRLKLKIWYNERIIPENFT